jgi:hypothetical protein
VGGCALDLYGLGQRLVAGFWEDGNERSGSKKAACFLSS